ncbi:MAG TPA: glutamate-cysteine ligase family protein [Thermoanaerobaculia bacterium]|nr:glutamate-cysteine ligase family protein [Thermoanaerobaculia bacterium]
MSRGPAAGPPWRLFEVVGLELEYPIVGPDLAVRPLVEEAFRKVHGRPTSDVEVGRAGFSNELAAHVFEIKNPLPLARLVEAEQALVEGVVAFSDLLEREWGARLLPTGMHPLMDPAREGRLWRRSGRRIYETYDRVFGVRGHGWLNVQSCHVNLPFGRSEAETVLLHDAIVGLLPYLPALAASSPLVEGRLGPVVDNRLSFYGTNQRRVPSIAGDVVPEPMLSFAGYRRDVLGRIYRDLDEIPEAARLHHEWVNSRGAIVRFTRRSIEIRVLDTQECVAMDVANAAFVRGALKRLVERLESGEVALPPHGVLVADYLAAVAEGTAARVAATHLRRLAGVGETVPLTAGELLAALAVAAGPVLAAEERPYLDRVVARLAGGNLSERIRRRIAPVPEAHRRAAIVELYGELGDCLRQNRVWEG